MSQIERRRPGAGQDQDGDASTGSRGDHYVNGTSAVGHFASFAPTDPESLAIDTDPEINAHTLADRGYPVFPAAAKDRPLVRWRSAATTDHTDISRWWHRWPDALVAVALPAGRLVVDADLYKPAAQDTMIRLESQYGPLPACPTVATPRGGRHYYFSVPRGVRFADVAGPGVDLRAGDRNYVLAPPSRVGTARYEWLAGEYDDPPDLPLSWLAGLEHRRPTLTTRNVPDSWVERLTGVRPEAASIADLDAFLDALPAGPMDLVVAAAVDGRMAERMRDTAHDTLVRSVYRVIALGAEGHPGAADGMARVLRAFVDENRRRERHGLDGVRSADELESEMLRAIFGAIIKVAAQ